MALVTRIALLFSLLLTDPSALNGSCHSNSLALLSFAYRDFGSEWLVTRLALLFSPLLTEPSALNGSCHKHSLALLSFAYRAFGSEWLLSQE
jgi:hypothetical protein